MAKKKQDSHKILLVQSNAVIQKEIEKVLLQSSVSFTIQKCSTKTEFARLVRSFNPVAIVSSYKIGRITALDFLPIQSTEKIPPSFIIISSSDNSSDTKKCLHAGADDFILESEIRTLPALLKKYITERQKKEQAISAMQSLRERDELFRLITETGNDFIAVLDTKGNRIYNNPAYESVLGDPSKLKGTSSFREIHPEDKEKIKQIFQETVKTGIGQKGEYRFIGKDGSIHFIESQGSVIKNEKGKTEKVVVVSRDITPRRRAEEEIQLLAQTMESINELACITNLKNEFIYVNDAFLRRYGYSKDEILGKHTSILLPPSKRTSVQEEILEQTKAANEWKGEMHNVTKGGEEFLISLSTSTVRNAEGIIIATVGIAEDISERARTLQSLKENEEKFRSLAENTTIGVLIIQGTKVLYVNPAHEIITGYSAAELYEKPFWEIMHPEFQEMVKHRGLLRQRGDEVPSQYSVKIIRKNGDERWLDVVSSTILYGGYNAIMVSTYDVTEQKQMVAQLQESEGRYKNLFENAITGNYISTPEGKILLCNNTFLQMLGFGSIEELQQINAASLYPETATREKLIATLKSEGSVKNYELTLARRDGTRITVIENVYPTFNAEGYLLQFTGYMFDITERKRAEELLRSAQHFNERIVATTPDVLYIFDLFEQRSIWRNESTYALLGYTREEIESAGTNFFTAFFHPDDVPQMVNEIQEIQKTKEEKIFHSEYRIKNKKGEWRWFSDRKAIFIRTNDGLPKQILGIAQDITDIKKSEEVFLKLSSAIEQTADNILITNKEGIIEYINPAFERFTGFTRNEILGKTPRILKSGLLDDKFYEKLWSTILAGNNFNAVFTNKKKNGELYYAEKTITPLKDKNGNITHFVSSEKDISERLHSEKILGESELKYRTLFEESKDTIYISTPEGKLLDVNPMGLELFGYPSKEELLQVDIARDLYLNSSDRGKLNARLEKEGYLRDVEFTIKRKNGELRTILETSTAVKNEKNDIIAYRGILRDITEKKLIEEKIKQQAALLDIAQDAIIVIDLNDIILFWNKGAESLYGWSKEEVLGKNVLSFAYSEVPSGREIAKTTVITNGEWQGELHQKTKSGKTVDVESHWTLVRDENGLPQSILIVNNDITERKLLEAQLLRSQRLESIGTLAGGIAHDFNNILGIILGYTSLLERHREMPDKFSKDVDAISNAIQRAAGLVKQMLTFARKSDVRLDSTNVNAVIEEVQKLLSETLPKTTELRIDLDRHIPTIIADSNQIHQTLLNLCVNARDAMPTGGSITIGSKIVSGDALRRRFIEATENEYVRITVADTGMGMDEATKNRIFEPFFTTKGPGKGTGLGLSVVYGIIKNHNGFIDVESEPGKGTSFYMYFPLQLRTEEPPLESAELSTSLTGTETLLIVEDEEMLRDFVKSLFEEHHYRVITAADGLEAIATFDKHQNEIDLVITDMGLPKLSGAEAFLKMRQRNPNIKVILASGFLDPHLKSELFKAGAKEFVQKPYHADDLLQKAREVLDRK
ncbi:MAG: PAS domain S-box protein [Ignavibacteriales bacterium]|nr:PAS domain S-box protein [Ignavibacteriales bacterium]